MKCTKNIADVHRLSSYLWAQGCENKQVGGILQLSEGHGTQLCD